MQINSINSILSCKAKFFNYNLNNTNFRGTSTDIGDTFLSTADADKVKRLKYERTKFLNSLYSSIWRNDPEEFEKLFVTGTLTPRNLKCLRQVFDEHVRHPWRGQVPDQRIGELIDEAIVNAEMGKLDHNPQLREKYSDIKTKIQYDSDDNKLSMEFLKQAIKRKDSVLLRVTIDTLRKNNKPYGQILFDSIDSLLQENNNS